MKTRFPSLLGAILLIAMFGHVLRSQAADALRLDIIRTNSNVLLTWTSADATLQSSLGLTGAWSVVTGAVSPLVISPTNLASFFRLWATNTPASFDFRYAAPTFTTSIGDPFGCGCTSPENPNSLATGGGAQDNGMGSVLLHTGELTQDAVDLEIPGRGFNWRFERRYRSSMSYDGPVGQGWELNYNRRLFVETNGHVLSIHLGRADRYLLNTNATFTSPAGFYTQLKRNLDGTFEERDRHGTTNFYSATNNLGIARLSRVGDRNANQMTFQYNTGGQLTNVVDTLARSIAYLYDPNGRLTTVTDFAGRALRFAYDSDGNLASATSPAVTGTANGNDFPSGKTTLYTYATGFADARFNHNLLSIMAPNEAAVSGPARLFAQYDTNPVSTNADRLVSLRLGGTNDTGIAAGGTISYTYASFGVVGSNDFATPVFQNTVTNRNGNVTQYRFNQQGSVVRTVQFTRGIRAGDPAAYTNSSAFNQDGEKIGQTNAELAIVQYTFDAANPDRLQRGNLRQIRSLPGPRGGDQAQIVVTNSYETNFNFIATSKDGRNNTLTFRYDSRGNRTNVLHRGPGIVEDFEYDSNGQMTAHVLPRNGSASRRRDVMVYYSSGSQTGYLQQSIVDSGGFNLTNRYEYDDVGNVTNSIDAKGSNTIFIVNSLNQVVRTFSRAVSTTNGLVRYQRSIFYDANDNVLRMDVQNIDDGGTIVSALPNFTTTNAYDILDFPLSTARQVTNNHYVTTEYRYDANGSRTFTRSGVATSGLQTNNAISTLYDERDLVFQEVLAPNDPAHSTTQLDYNGNGSLVRRSQGTESNPRITSFARDGYDRETAATNAMGNVITTHYDANGNRVSTRVNGELADVPGTIGNVRLSEIVFTYDEEDRLTKSDSALFNTATQTNIGTGHVITSIAYSANSQVITNIDANTNAFITKYDTANRLLVTTDAKTNTVTFTYDANNNIVRTTEVDLSDLGSPSQIIQTTNTYDGLDRLIQTVDNAGNTNRYAYDSRNNRVASTEGRGNVTRYTYDGLNRLTATTRFLTSNGLGGGTPAGTIVTRQGWDDNSRLTGQTDANTNTTTYAYDALNRMTRTVFADGTTNGAAFDVHHNRTTATDANGNVMNATFDLGNRATATAITRGAGVSGTTGETNRYDGAGRIVGAADDDSIVTRSYDSLSRVLRETQQVLPGGSTQTVACVYDGEGNRLACTYPGGRLINSTYDRLDRLQTVSDSAGLIAHYDYFGPGRVERRDNGNGTRADYGYDEVRRMTNSLQTRIVGGALIDSRSYAWDAAHNKTALNDLLAPAQDSKSFGYDSVSRLIRSATAVAGPTNSYSLDGVGNRLSVTGGTNAGLYFMSAAVPPADFPMNQYTTTPFDARAHDGNGNLASAGPQRFVYDYRNQLVSYSNATSGLTVTFQYDCFRRRLQKVAGGTTNRYYYAGGQEIEEQDGANAPVATYVWGRGLDALVEMERDGQSYFFHADDLGSVRKVTDAAGNVVEQYNYGDYGEPRFFAAAGGGLASTQIGNFTLYTGRRYDPETGLYYCRTRYLDPAAGRFTARDSTGIWENEGNLGNGATYGGNNPWAIIVQDGFFPVAPKNPSTSRYGSASGYVITMEDGGVFPVAPKRPWTSGSASPSGYIISTEDGGCFPVAPKRPPTSRTPSPSGYVVIVQDGFFPVAPKRPPTSGTPSPSGYIISAEDGIFPVAPKRPWASGSASQSGYVIVTEDGGCLPVAPKNPSASRYGSANGYVITAEDGIFPVAPKRPWTSGTAAPGGYAIIVQDGI